MIENIKKIGISMRVLEEINYDEPRDALAHNWHQFLVWALGNSVSWILIPNIGKKKTKVFIHQQQLTGFILSGGNDIGEYPIRDETETALIEYAMAYNLPVIGVCRGLQMLWQNFGGQIIPVDTDKHIAKRHKVKITQPIRGLLRRDLEIEVNSFHANGLLDTELTSPIKPFAHADDGEIEGVIWQEMKVLGMMWHPEREQPFSSLDKKLFRWALLGEMS